MMNNGAGSSGGGIYGGSGGGGGGFSNGESGILRKTTGGHHHHHHHHLLGGAGGGQDAFADLLVFGYSCKIFRDDEKARFIDAGRHLIPWMGDNSLKIDRYDARGALHDLSQHEPPIGGYGNRVDCLAPAEQRAEQLCEEERYYSLYANEVEEEIYQEEAAKRQALSGAEIAFDYDAAPVDGAAIGPVPAESAGVGEDDENSNDPPFEAPSGFEIPSDLELPETMKEHAIIEKTAKFIASQDSQMEILLRAKQASNPQFNFLTPGGKLYRYYRHVLMAIKTNRYPEEVEPVPEKEAEPDPAAEEAEVAPKPKVVVPSIKYKPSVDCAYTQLISKITGAPIPPENQTTVSAPLTPTRPTSLNTEYEYSLEPKPVEVSKVSTGLAGLVQYNSDSEDSSAEPETKEEEKKPEPPKVEKREIVFTGTLPPEIFQHVIEKTATYVAKNGYSFEDALRTKNDPRFLFLRKDHEFYPYFAFRVRYLINPYEEVPKSPEKVTITREIENGTVVETPSIGIKTVNTAAPVPVPVQQTQIQSTKPGGAVCFSIKTKEDVPVALKSNVMQELGADEEESEPAKYKEKSKSPSREKDVPVEEKPAEKVVEEQRSTTPPAIIDMFSDEIKPKAKTPPPVEEPKLPSADEEAKEQKRLEDRIKDKLTAAAREKLAAITREKQLQLERKKRASMFLSMMNKADPIPLKNDPPTASTPPAPDSSPNDTPPLTPAQNGTESLKSSDDNVKTDGNQSDEASIHSIPSQSTTPESHQVLSSDDDDVVLVGVSAPKDNGRQERRSRSRTRSGSKHKKSSSRKHKHKSKSKKSKKKKSRSRSPSRNRSTKTSTTSSSKRKRARSSSRSESSRRSRSRSRDAKKKKKESKKKSHKHHKSSRSSSRSKNRHGRRDDRREGENFDWDAL